MDLAKKALDSAAVFDAYQRLIGAPDCHRQFIRLMLAPRAGERILDIGCGVGASVSYMPTDVSYVGVDISKRYIAKARTKYGERGQFICADVTSLGDATIGRFDRAFCFGVLHHLADDAAAQAIDFVRRVVKPGGLFVSIDPCYISSQHRVAKLLIANDRGKHVRDPAGFAQLVAALGRVRTEVYHGLLRIPYTQIVMWVTVDGEAACKPCMGSHGDSKNTTI